MAYRAARPLTRIPVLPTRRFSSRPPLSTAGPAGSPAGRRSPSHRPTDANPAPRSPPAVPAEKPSPKGHFLYGKINPNCSGHNTRRARRRAPPSRVRRDPPTLYRLPPTPMHPPTPPTLHSSLPTPRLPPRVGMLEASAAYPALPARQAGLWKVPSISTYPIPQTPSSAKYISLPYTTRHGEDAQQIPPSTPTYPTPPSRQPTLAAPRGAPSSTWRETSPARPPEYREPALGKSRRRTAYPQQIVTTRLLYCLQDRFAQLSRLQRI